MSDPDDPPADFKTHVSRFRFRLLSWLCPPAVVTIYEHSKPPLVLRLSPGDTLEVTIREPK